MKVLGINISHDASICVYENNKISDFWVEERFNNEKKWYPDNCNEEFNDIFYLSILKKINFKPDLVCYSSYTKEKRKNSNKKIIESLQKQLDNPKYYFDDKKHHVYHALCGFYFSKFDEAISLVIDGGGAHPFLDGFQEFDSIFYVNKKNIFTIFQHLSNIRYMIRGKNIENYSDHTFQDFKENTEFLFTSKSNPGFDFNRMTPAAGFGNEHGKLMGLSSYAYSYENFNLNYNQVKMAKETQEKSFLKTCKLIEKCLTYKNIKNIVLSGGYFLNCSNNFKYVKKYPDLNFFVDPIPHDGGTSIGVCLYNDYK